MRIALPPLHFQAGMLKPLVFVKVMIAAEIVLELTLAQ